MLNLPLAGSIAHTLPHPLLSLLAFQAETVDGGQMKLLVVFVGIAAISLLFMACVLLGAIVAGAKAQRELGGEIKKLRDDASLLIDKSHTLIVELTPQIRQIAAKVETITGHVEQLTALVHQKADEISPTISAANQTVLEANTTVRETIRTANATVLEANNKTRAQISRVDSMVTSALNSTIRLGIAIEHGIARPGREVAGVVAGLKAGFDVFAAAAARALNPRPVPPRSTPPRPLPEPVRPTHPANPDSAF
jgi:hypothetical protein